MATRPVGRVPGPAYSITIRAEYPNKVGLLGRLTSTIGWAGGDIGAVDIVSSTRDHIVRDISVNCVDVAHAEEIVKQVRAAIPMVRILRVGDQTFQRHIGGKIAMQARVPTATREDFNLLDIPAANRVSLAIQADPGLVWSLTAKGHTVAVVTDGTAVLGLGDIGPEAGLPVMEGKCIIFKEFGGVDAWPIALRTKDPDKIVELVKLIAPAFGGINLEDISAPRCFYIEERLKKELDIPVFHDDQHGTATVVLAGLMNALKIIRKKMEDLHVVMAGAGAAGIATCKLIMAAGVKDIVFYDREGLLHRGGSYPSSIAKQWAAENTNPRNIQGTLMDAMEGADLFIGVSGPGVLKVEHVRRMARDPIIFAMANPDPEIMPGEVEGLVRIMATGRSDFPNQVNNSLCFPGLFRGVLEVRARDINDPMKIAAAEAIAACVAASELNEEHIMPSMFDTNVARAVSRAVAAAAYKTGVAQRPRRRTTAVMGQLQYH